MGHSENMSWGRLIPVISFTFFKSNNLYLYLLKISGATKRFEFPTLDTEINIRSFCQFLGNFRNIFFTQSYWKSFLRSCHTFSDYLIPSRSWVGSSLSKTMLNISAKLFGTPDAILTCIACLILYPSPTHSSTSRPYDFCCCLIVEFALLSSSIRHPINWGKVFSQHRKNSHMIL